MANDQLQHTNVYMKVAMLEMFFLVYHISKNIGWLCIERKRDMHWERMSNPPEHYLLSLSIH